MTLHISVAVIVTDTEDSDLVKVIKADTSVNPSPADTQAAVLLAAGMVDRLVTEAGRDAIERLSELHQALENIENA